LATKNEREPPRNYETGASRDWDGIVIIITSQINVVVRNATKPFITVGAIMEKYIGFDIDDKKTVACVAQKGKKDRYDTMRTDVSVMKRWREKQRKPGTKLHLTFEVSGQAGWLYENLTVCGGTVSPPSWRHTFNMPARRRRYQYKFLCAEVNPASPGT
jgi:hypothetical protein